MSKLNDTLSKPNFASGRSFAPMSDAKIAKVKKISSKIAKNEKSNQLKQIKFLPLLTVYFYFLILVWILIFTTFRNTRAY